ncbi:SGNH/GDSL hydrolase family protein [Streptomyces turgidiscabies]|uniref:Esterase family protein n=1 Tax=Streptomyces turgidiscabies (strain Car8) TaxID=698760 RepID=L7EW23_STRT8|nr:MULTISPECIES: SGNH/GDSL hydrolase family protein [Streptomyces]ELP63242.1 esterase family protein [Streptomyces turgidiscabies Car8]MDX3493192.1 SGNH/GDSL hydrolase family protein [Streptomyces turgidiscabies]
MRKTTTTPRARRLAAVAAALGSCLALAVPAGTAAAAPADPVPTVFFGDSYTANFGIAPVNNQDNERGWCFQATENYPAVAARSLADKGITLNVQSDVSCGGALVEHFWREQPLLGGGTAPAQRDALKDDTRLLVGGIGGNTFGFTNILKQCSATLRGDQGGALPGEPVDRDSPADECADFFTSGDGKAWLDYKAEQVESELVDMLDGMGGISPYADRVLVGYPRLVPQDTTKCATAAPGQTELPFADIPQDALPVLDQAQKRLDGIMKKAAYDSGADFVDLYDHTGNNTACDGVNRGIGGLLEGSKVVFGTPIPWYAHPNEKGRDIQAERVAAKIEEVLNR